jgi:hypothetical protein
MTPTDDAAKFNAIRAELIEVTGCLVQIHTLMVKLTAAVPVEAREEIWPEVTALSERLKDVIKHIEANPLNG